MAARLLRPQFDIERENLAPATRIGGYLLSKALPLMILLMVLLGAFYPAIDVTAGERERGTLETVLAAPIPRLDLLLGKVLAVTALASASGLLNLASMSLTLVQVVNLAAPAADLPVPWSAGRRHRPGGAAHRLPAGRPVRGRRLAGPRLQGGPEPAGAGLLPVLRAGHAGRDGRPAADAGAGAGARPERQPAGPGHRPGQGRRPG